MCFSDGFPIKLFVVYQVTFQRTVASNRLQKYKINTIYKTFILFVVFILLNFNEKKITNRYFFIEYIIKSSQKLSFWGKCNNSGKG